MYQIVSYDYKNSSSIVVHYYGDKLDEAVGLYQKLLTTFREPQKLLELAPETKDGYLKVKSIIKFS